MSLSCSMNIDSSKDTPSKLGATVEDAIHCVYILYKGEKISNDEME